jgi:hypothetical protein
MSIGREFEHWRVIRRDPLLQISRGSKKTWRSFHPTRPLNNTRIADIP